VVNRSLACLLERAIALADLAISANSFSTSASAAASLVGDGIHVVSCPFSLLKKWGYADYTLPTPGYWRLSNVALSPAAAPFAMVGPSQRR